ncbi:MAG: plasmid pRiA4b ORF-3 family protein [Firmicutes bacterium]|nr:plasmid pRiA4b ORF-3 family protein [Bacillota bacterium]
MLIQCTKSLIEKLGIQKNDLQSPEGFEQFPASLKAWHANLVNLNRRKAIVLMNNETRYPIVIYRPKPKDFSKIRELIVEAIRTALRMEGVRKDIIDAYIADTGEIEFSKTAGKSLVAKMNNSINDIAYLWEYLDENTLIQRYISIAAGRFIQTSPNGEDYYPAQKFLEYLGLYSEQNQVTSSDAVRGLNLYQLKIQIVMEGYDIWRRVLVPSTYSFRHLHKIIQTIFDWQNYHLHMFEAKKTGAKYKQIVMDDDPESLDWLDFDRYDLLQEQFVSLEDILPDHEEVTYEYDFGDSWEHKIILEKVVKSNSFKATFIEGEGERPPEDVGGTWGYHEYKRIMADPDDPEYESMKIWSESQKERDMSKEQINDRLRRAISSYEYYYN